MAKRFSPSVLTANHLIEGDTVWWTGSEWTRDIAEASVAESPENAALLEALAEAPGVEAEVVGPYLVEVTSGGGAPRPIVRREAIRADREPTFVYAAPALESAA